MASRKSTTTGQGSTPKQSLKSKVLTPLQERASRMMEAEDRDYSKQTAAALDRMKK